MAKRSTRSKAAVQHPLPRPAEAVAKRCIVLIAVIGSGHGDRRSKLLPWLKNEGLLKHVSPREMRVLKAKSLSLRDRAYATWRIEALLPLLWALGKWPKLSTPSQMRSSIRGRMPIPMEPTAEFISAAKLRPARTISREQERVYDQNWKVRDAELKGKKPPRGLDPEVVQERHHAFNWLVNEANEPWDEVSTDT